MCKLTEANEGWIDCNIWAPIFDNLFLRDPEFVLDRYICHPSFVAIKMTNIALGRKLVPKEMVSSCEEHNMMAFCAREIQTAKQITLFLSPNVLPGPLSSATQNISMIEKN